VRFFFDIMREQMPASAPRSSILAHATRLQIAKESQTGGRVILAGVEYPAEYHIGAAEPEQDERGRVSIVERGWVKIRKALLAAVPKRGAVLQLGGVDYYTDSTTAAPNAAAWKITFHRLAPVA
jgi:hypothetical protein